MGRPSDKCRSARRPGKRERTRVKNRHRGQMWMQLPIKDDDGLVIGVVRASVKAGRKKFRRLHGMFRDGRTAAHLVGDSETRKSRGSTKRPIYTVELVRYPTTGEEPPE